jgi:hypothetical protein
MFRLRRVGDKSGKTTKYEKLKKVIEDAKKNKSKSYMSLSLAANAEIDLRDLEGKCADIFEEMISAIKILRDPKKYGRDDIGQICALLERAEAIDLSFDESLKNCGIPT